MDELETLKYVSVNADCRKKSKCDVKFNSDECKLRFITASCQGKGLKEKNQKEKDK